MSAIERAKAHFSAKEVKVIEVPEWGEDNKPLMVYSKPMTLAEKKRLFNSSKDTDIGVLVDVLILKCRDEKGDAIFTLEHKRDLMNAADPDVIGRVANQILTEPSVDDHLKN